MKNIRYVVNHLVGDPSKIGCVYMASTAEIILDRGAFPYKSLLVDLYPAVGMQYRVTASGVSRAIARAVEDCWDHGNRAYLEEVAGHEVRQKPSPAQLLAWIVDYVMGE